MGYVLDTLLGAYDLKPVNLSGRQEIDIQRLPAKYKEAFACIFYPKTMVSMDDIEYLETFWGDNGRSRLNQYVELIRFYNDDEVVYGDSKGVFSISVIVSHFKSIQRPLGIATTNNRGSLRLRGIIIPERYVVDRFMDVYARNQLKLVNTMADNPTVKFLEDSGLYVKTEKPYILILDNNELSSHLPLKVGSDLGKCDCVEDMISIYMHGIYYIILIEKSVWFEFQIKATGLSKLSPLTHPLLRKIRANFNGVDLKRIPLQFIMSNLSNYRSIDMLNYDAIADTAIRQESMSQCIEYCISMVKQDSSAISQTHFNQVVDSIYPQFRQTTG